MSNPAQLLTTIRDQLTEKGPAFWSDPEIYGYMSQGENLMSQRLDCVQDSSSVNTTPYLREYDNPSNAITTLRLTWKGQKLKKIDMREMDTVEGDTTTSGTPVYYYDFANIVGLVPTPVTADTLKWYYTGHPVALTSDSSAFSVPNYFSEYIADYALYRCFNKDAETRTEATFHLSLWTDNLDEAEKIWFKKRYKDRIFTVKDEENYPGTDLGII